MVTTNAFAAPSPGAPLVATTIERRKVGPKDVLIDIAYCGVCHSDIHTVQGKGSDENFPLVPGHEIAGTITEVGDEVTRYRVGDTVGVGCFVNSCKECENCRGGREQFCARGVTFSYAAVDVDGTMTQGGYSEKIVVDEDYVLRIPDGLDLAAAAPLLCAGITLYSPLRQWGAGPGKKVAIVGLGGLGHMGVKIGAAMGADITVLSQSLKKREDGLRFGASEYLATSDPNTFSAFAGTFDLIINTVSAPIDLDAYLSLLATDGTLVNIGMPPEPLTVGAFSLLMGNKKLAGTLIGGIAETQEMLEFCAEHDITADIEVIAGSQINEAYERVIASDVRYRFVIDSATLKDK